jgi:hypothetical protein
MKIPMNEIDLACVVFAQHELTLLFEYYPQEVSFEKERLEVFRDLLRNLSSEPQDEHLSSTLNRIVSQYLSVPLYERWGNVTMEMEEVAQMITAICKGEMSGELYLRNLVRLIEFCNIFYKKLDQELHGARNFNLKLVPA